MRTLLQALCFHRAFLLIPLTPLALEAQQTEQVQAAPAGSVEGDVYDAASRRPVRFALVRLVPKPQDMDEALSAVLPAEGRPQQRTGVTSVAGAADMNGHFRLGGVPVGEYYIAGVQRGYVAQGKAALADFTSMAKQIRDAAAAFATVRITAGGVAQVHLPLERAMTYLPKMNQACDAEQSVS